MATAGGGDEETPEPLYSNPFPFVAATGRFGFGRIRTGDWGMLLSAKFHVGGIKPRTDSMQLMGGVGMEYMFMTFLDQNWATVFGFGVDAHWTASEARDEYAYISGGPFAGVAFAPIPKNPGHTEPHGSKCGLRESNCKGDPGHRLVVSGGALLGTGLSVSAVGIAAEVARTREKGTLPRDVRSREVYRSLAVGFGVAGVLVTAGGTALLTLGLLKRKQGKTKVRAAASGVQVSF